MASLREFHYVELTTESVDDVEVVASLRFVSSIRLLLQHWQTGDATGASDALSHFAEAWRRELNSIIASNEMDVESERTNAEEELRQALHCALQWYKAEAEEDLDGMLEAYCSPDRALPDGPDDVVSNSVWTAEPLACNFETLRPFQRARSLIRLLFSAVGPDHDITRWARAELAVLLDRRKHVPFFTRRFWKRRGGGPELGRCSGRTSGYPRRYWIAWGPGTFYPNTKPMGGPHTADGKHSFM